MTQCTTPSSDLKPPQTTVLPHWNHPCHPKCWPGSCRKQGGDHCFLPSERQGTQLAAVSIRDHSFLPINPLLPKKVADMLQLMKASLLFDQDPQILEIMTAVLPAGLPTGFAYQLLPPSAPPLLALLLAGTWLSSRAARIQPEEALCQPGRRFSPCFGAEWQQHAFACPASLPSTVVTSVPGAQPCWSWAFHAGKHITAALPSCKHSPQRYLGIFC